MKLRASVIAGLVLILATNIYASPKKRSPNTEVDAIGTVGSVSEKSNPEPRGDETWRLCYNDTLILNSLEHRSATGGPNARVIDLVLLYGNYLYTGKFDDTNSYSGSVALAGSSPKRTFLGDISLDVQKNIISLKGKLGLADSVGNVNVKLPCKIMTGQL